jgi:hypothetical protein
LDPTILHRSRSGSIIQLLFFSLFAALCLWMLLDITSPTAGSTATVANSGTALDPTPGILFDELPKPRQQGLEDRLTGGWYGVVAMLVGVVYSLSAVLIRLWYLLTGMPTMLSIQNRTLAQHGTFFTPPRTIELHNIRSVEFDRADRLSEDGDQQFLKAVSLSSWLGLRLGRRLRYVLRISFVSESGTLQSLEYQDINVEGGIAQMDRFATYLQAMIMGQPLGSFRARLRQHDRAERAAG